MFPHLRHDVLLSALFTVLVCSQFAVATDTETTLPRYKFKVGQELLYKLVSEEKLLWENETGREMNREWRIYVVGHNPDGSWKLVVRSTVKNIKVPVEGDPIVTFENDFLGNCNLQPDGSYAPNWSMGYHFWFKFYPDEVLLRLPQDQKELQKGWQYDAPASGAQLAFHTESLDSGNFQFVGRRTEQTDAANETIRTVDVDFDSLRGLATRIVTNWNVQRGANGKNGHVRFTVELIDVYTHDERWVSTFSSEADKYLAVNEKYWRTYERLSYLAESRLQCSTILNELRKSLVEAREYASLTKELYSARIAIHDEHLATSALARAEKREPTYSMAPLDWVTTDFDDERHQLQDYRGQVVLLDFWYSGCTHCIKAIPALKALSKKYATAPVTILGVNNDRHDRDALHVIDRFDLRYQNLRNSGISKRYSVGAWPTFIVLDQSGRVASIHEGGGNLERLELDISQVIDELLQ